MKNILLAAILVLTGTAHADLLDRMHLEEALRDRLEQVAHVKDKDAKVLTRVEYKVFKSDLPGTSTLAADDFSPSKLESTDITRVYVEVYTELTELPADVKESMFHLIPVERSKIQLVTRHVDAPPTVPVLKPVEAKDLSQIAQQSIESLAKIVFVSMGLFMALLLGGVLFYSSRKMKEFKAQFNLLAKAISEGSERAPSLPASAANALNAPPSAAVSEAGMAALKNLPSVAIQELFADCYWCEADAYAHWLWKNLSSEQRSSEIQSLPFMKEYSLSFVQGPAQEQNHHEHPFYLNPNSCRQLSMQDVNEEVKKNLGLWHQLSPLRQSHCDLSLEQKLQALQAKSTVLLWSSFPPSTPRILKSKAAWGEISLEDESLLYQNPSLVPENLKENIRSLVWLARKEAPEIQKVLSRYDARSLAGAWIGADEVLKKLEEHLPEKKLKLLLTYREKTPAARSSYIYQSLVEEGLRSDAA